MGGAPPPRLGPSAKSQKRLKLDAFGGDQRFKRKCEDVYREKPSLELWHDLSSRLIEADIVPTRLRDVTQQHVSTSDVEMHALIGDKIFGAALLEEIVGNRLCKDTGEATRQYSEVASNASMAQLVSECLPQHVQGGREVEEHSAGTLVEAAVYMVNQMAGGPQAVQQLAKWFVYNVVVEGKKQRRFTNPKGLIIELNGHTMSHRIEGTADHEPAFQARCVWPKEAPREQQRETTAIGKSKKEAEANAAKEMLEIYGHEIYNAPAQESAKLKEKKDLKMENAYGHLLTLGGVLVGECINTASTNETARYVATVRLGNDEARAEATSKKQAIRLASQQILEANGEYD